METFPGKRAVENPCTFSTPPVELPTLAVSAFPALFHNFFLYGSFLLTKIDSFLFKKTGRDHLSQLKGRVPMKFSCEKTLLQSAIAVTSRAVAQKSSIPALEGLLLHADHQLTVSG